MYVIPSCQPKERAHLIGCTCYRLSARRNHRGTDPCVYPAWREYTGGCPWVSSARGQPDGTASPNGRLSFSNCAPLNPRVCPTAFELFNWLHGQAMHIL